MTGALIQMEGLAAQTGAQGSQSDQHPGSTGEHQHLVSAFFLLYTHAHIVIMVKKKQD